MNSEYSKYLLGEKVLCLFRSNWVPIFKPQGWISWIWAGIS